MVNKYIFREYDIRGRVVDDFPPHVVTILGQAFGTFVKRNGFREIALRVTYDSPPQTSWINSKVVYYQRELM